MTPLQPQAAERPLGLRFGSGKTSMLTIRHSGPDLRAIAQQIGNVPKSMIPYAASTALTRVAKHAAAIELPAEMRKVFSAPTAYALNSLRTVPASKNNLVARVAVKDQASEGSIAPEKFLLAEVEGGARRRKRMENALGYSGVLGGIRYVMPGYGVDRDAAGNIPGGRVRTILKAAALVNATKPGLKAAPYANSEDRKRKTQGDILAEEISFIGRPRHKNRPEGIWVRNRATGGLNALLIFPRRAPKYPKRLDFNGTVLRVSDARFKDEFARAVSEMKARGGTWA